MQLPSHAREPFPCGVHNKGAGQSCCAAARAQSEVAATEAVAAKQEASTLRAELQLLRAAMQHTKTAHQHEIAQLLQSAACHQAQVTHLMCSESMLTLDTGRYHCILRLSCCASRNRNSQDRNASADSVGS